MDMKGRLRGIYWQFTMIFYVLLILDAHNRFNKIGNTFCQFGNWIR